MGRAKSLKHACQGSCQVGIEDAHELPSSTGRIGQRADNVKDRSDANVATHIGCMAGGLVVERCKQKGQARCLQLFSRLFRGRTGRDP